MKLSILMPVYNEESSLKGILSKILTVDLEKEIIIVNDASTDSTADILKEYANTEEIMIINHDKNLGKGRAIRTAISKMTGNIAIIQDGDLEYDPEDYYRLIEPIAKGQQKVVYGSRILNKNNGMSYRSFYWGGRLVTIITNLLYGLRLTDEPTCYKVFDAELLKSLPLKCEGFEFCPEVTARIAKRKIPILELPINYYPRKVEEGKKITWLDGLEAVATLVKYRFYNG